MFVYAKMVPKHAMKSPFTILVQSGCDLIKLMVIILTKYKAGVIKRLE